MAKAARSKNSEGLFGNITSDTPTPSDQEIQFLDPLLLDEDPMNEEIYNMFGIEALAKSIKKNGMLEPIRAYKYPDKDRYLIQAGHRRRKAAIVAAVKKVPVIILEWEPNPNIRQQKLIENNLDNRIKSPMTIAKEYNAYKETLDDSSNLLDEMANRMGRSKATIRRYLSLLDLIPELQEKVENEDVYSMSAISEAKTMTPVQQTEFNQLIDNYVEQNGESKITREIIITFARDIKGETRIGRPSNSFTVKSFSGTTKRYISLCNKIQELSTPEEKQEAKKLLLNLLDKIQECIDNI